MADNMLRERMKVAQPAATAQGSNALRSLLGFLSDSQSWQDMGRNALNMIGSPLPTQQEAMANALRRRLQGSVMRDYPGAETDAANAYREKMQNVALGMNPVLATVWHGSPHKFDKFDMSKIGTGEGAQAYGHGLYFAESPAVAKGYRDKLQTVKYGGNSIDPSNPEHVAVAAIEYAKDSKKAAEYLKNQAKLMDYDVNMAAAKLIDSGKVLPQREANGNLYKVDLPDDQIARMLDWDKPLSQQPEAIKKLMGKRYEAWKNESGQSLYESLSEKLGGDKETSKWLAENGIAGIRYLDGGSRGAGQGTSNFVVFDDRIPKILGRE